MVVEATALADAKAGSTELPLKLGEKVTVVNAGGLWWIAKNGKGDIGYVPSNFLAVSVSAKALWDCKADADGELSFKAGDTITNIVKTGTLPDFKGALSKDWWYGTCNGEEGIFPSCYVLEEKPPVLLKKEKPKPKAEPKKPAAVPAPKAKLKPKAPLKVPQKSEGEQKCETAEDTGKDEKLEEDDKEQERALEKEKTKAKAKAKAKRDRPEVATPSKKAPANAKTPAPPIAKTVNPDKVYAIGQLEIKGRFGRWKDYRFSLSLNKLHWSEGKSEKGHVKMAEVTEVQDGPENTLIVVAGGKKTVVRTGDDRTQKQWRAHFDKACEYQKNK